MDYNIFFEVLVMFLSVLGLKFRSKNNYILIIIIESIWLIIRSYEKNFLPITSVYEGIIIIHYIIQWVNYIKTIKKEFFYPYVNLVIVFVFLPFISSKVTLVPPSLRSVWLVFHILVTFSGQAMIIISAFNAFLFIKNSGENKMSYIDVIRQLKIGYVLFTVGALVLGPIYAKIAWGNFWQSDVKEIWSLISWMMFAVFFYIEKNGKISRISKMKLIVLSTFMMLFNFLFVSYLFLGLHTYL